MKYIKILKILSTFMHIIKIVRDIPHFYSGQQPNKPTHKMLTRCQHPLVTIKQVVSVLQHCNRVCTATKYVPL